MHKLGAAAGSVCLLAALSTSAGADLAVVEGIFAKAPPGAAAAVPITSASMDDRHICLVVRGTELPDGEHSIRTTALDGKGHEANHLELTLRPVRGHWQALSCYTYNTATDAPGDWDFTVEVDGKQVLERSIYVAAGTAKP
ncbi:MAG: hypothetical protein P4L83_19020 [Nevskia sp.]|nr:hypothetical protein [Nevskia sp.]